MAQNAGVRRRKKEITHNHKPDISVGFCYTGTRIQRIKQIRTNPFLSVQSVSSVFQFHTMKTLSIQVLPRSSRNEIVGTLPDGTIKVKLTAPPVDGEANKKLIDLLSKEYGVTKSRVRIVRGERGRKKTVEIGV